MAVFGESFSNTTFEGPRAQPYSRPEDLFQQLVGDALREIAAPLAQVTLTRGRDGGIDTWVENPGDSEHKIKLFGLEMPTPFIIECKYHDEAASDPTDNTKRGCRKVLKKLQEQADNNWSGLFAPWKKARGYIYCISNVIHPTLRLELTKIIKEFFETLPRDRRPPLEGNISVKDWGDIAYQLNGLPRVTDAWLGVKLENILGHEEYVAGLAGFRAYLKEDNLSFVPPPENDPVHPERIFEALSTGKDKPGIIIYGPGGVGKTRTALEVAALAHAAGWRVLHVFPGEPPVTAGDLLGAATPGPGKVLMVLDYIDQMHALNFAEIRRRVLSEAESREIRLGLLANARPKVREEKDEEQEALFEKILLTPDIGTENRITENIVNEIAPTAKVILGLQTVRRLCGRRPIIAMFVARELEKRAEQRTLTAEGVADVRGGDLMTWLRKRLNEARLALVPAESFVPPEPAPEVVAAAAALASVPIRREEIITGTGETVGALGGDRRIATRVVDMLITLGWLEGPPGHIETAHDVVCDEVLERVLRTDPTDRIYNRALAGFLAPAISSPRILGRYAVALGRLLGTSRVPEAFRAELETATAGWLAENASGIGATLAACDADESAYAMGAAFAGPPWAGVYLNFWDELLRPWLDKHGRHLTARHLYYRLLKVAGKGEVARLIGPALAWLREHGATLEACFVLPPLLDRGDLSGGDRKAAVVAAQAWLDAHGTALQARFVIRSLLGRDDLSKEDSAATVGRALAWLDIHRHAVDAQFVIRPLLARDDLSADESKAAVTGALAWLDKHGAALEADFVLRPILERPDVSTEARAAAVSGALTWLEIHSATLDAQFVIRPLLARDDLSTNERTAALAGVRAYLDTHGAALEAQFIFHSLLARDDLSKEDRAAAVGGALAWLDIHGGALEAAFVLPPLLKRDDLSTEARMAAVTGAIAWLAIHRGALEAGFVLPPLLKRDDLSTEARAAAVAGALTWLDRFPNEQGTEFVLKPLLTLLVLNRTVRNRCARIALSRLGFLSNQPEANFILSWLLAARGLEPQIRRAVFDSAIDWLLTNATHPKADYVLRRILRNRSVTDAQWHEAALMALSWLKRKPAGADRDHILTSLFVRFGLLIQKDQEALITEAVAWLESIYPSADNAGYLISYIERNAGSALPPTKLEELKRRWRYSS